MVRRAWPSPWPRGIVPWWCWKRPGLWSGFALSPFKAHPRAPGPWVRPRQGLARALMGSPSGLCLPLPRLPCDPLPHCPAACGLRRACSLGSRRPALWLGRSARGRWRPSSVPCPAPWAPPPRPALARADPLGGVRGPLGPASNPCPAYRLHCRASPCPLQQGLPRPRSCHRRRASLPPRPRRCPHPCSRRRVPPQASRAPALWPNLLPQRPPWAQVRARLPRPGRAPPPRQVPARGPTLPPGPGLSAWPRRHLGRHGGLPPGPATCPGRPPARPPWPGQARRPPPRSKASSRVGRKPLGRGPLHRRWLPCPRGQPPPSSRCLRLPPCAPWRC
jgi:hypothetical protein